VDLRCREVGESSTYAKPQKIRLKGIQNFIVASVQENFFSVFSIASSAQENFFSFFFNRFIGEGKLFFGLFYRFIGPGIFFSVFYIASSVQENFFRFFLSLHRCRKTFYRFFLSLHRWKKFCPTKLYRFIRFFSQKLCFGIALIDTFFRIAAHLWSQPLFANNYWFQMTEKGFSELF
jgi:hypothetical protein